MSLKKEIIVFAEGKVFLTKSRLNYEKVKFFPWDYQNVETVLKKLESFGNVKSKEIIPYKYYISVKDEQALIAVVTKNTCKFKKITIK